MDSDDQAIGIAIGLGIAVIFLSAVVGAFIMEGTFVKRLESGMTPYVSTMKTLEWREHE